jgi:hypothetical protein
MYDAQQRGIKGAPKKVQVGVTGACTREEENAFVSSPEQKAQRVLSRQACPRTAMIRCDI